MVAIKAMEIPKDCKKCPLMGTDGNPKDLLNPMMCVAIWATTHEIKHCVGGKILDDCPLVEIEERKVGKWVRKPIRNDKGGCIGAKMICSCCNKDNRHDEYMDYCPNCGVEMIKEQSYRKYSNQGECQ
jgi:predicted RNA-binding Zn-ribbon protein involved in translation (DUF1610 family)